MGYASSYCEICGGPTNTVVSEFPDTGVEFEVGPQHAWLARLIALLPEYERTTIEIQDGVAEPPQVLRGEIDDHGEFTTEDGGRVSAGWVGGYLVVHEECWEIAGRPLAEDLLGLDGPDLAKYHQQYFEWGALASAGESWKLDPPHGRSPGSERNKARLEALTAPLRAKTAGRPAPEVGALGGEEPLPREQAPPRLEAPAPKKAPEPEVPGAPIDRRFEKTDGTTRKFWEIHVAGASF